MIVDGNMGKLADNTGANVTALGKVTVTAGSIGSTGEYVDFDLGVDAAFYVEATGDIYLNEMGALAKLEQLTATNGSIDLISNDDLVLPDVLAGGSVKLDIQGELTVPTITAGGDATVMAETAQIGTADVTGKLTANVTGDMTINTATAGSLEVTAENLTVNTKLDVVDAAAITASGNAEIATFEVTGTTAVDVEGTLTIGEA